MDKLYPTFKYKYKNLVVADIAEEWAAECMKPERERLSIPKLIKLHFEAYGLMRKDNTVIQIEDDTTTEEDTKDEGH